MNSQTIQELEIKIRANVESARNEIKKVVQDTKNMSSEINKQMNNLNNSGGINKFKEAISKSRETIQKFKRDFQTGFYMDTNQAQQELNMLEKELEKTKNKLDNMKNSELSFSTKDIQSAEKNIKILETRISDLKGDLNTVNSTPFGKLGNIISKIKDTVGKAKNGIKQLIDKIKAVGQESEKQKKKTSSFGEGITKSMKSGVKSIKKFVLSLLSVRTAFTMISKAAQAYLSFDTQLNDSIQNSWNVLGSLLAPVLEFVAGLFSKLVNGVAAFVKALTGIDLVARANAKALDKQTKSTKAASSASKQLSSIDDIENLSSGSGGGDGDSPQTITANIDETPFLAFINKMKPLLAKIFEPFKTAWENVGEGVFESLKSMIESIGDLGQTVGGSLLEVWTNGTGQEIIENALLQWQDIFDIIGAVADAFSHAWENDGNGTSIIQHIADIFKDIQKFCLDITDSLKKWVISDSFQEALDKIFGFIDDIFSYVKDICDWLLDMYDKYIKPVIDEKLLPAIDSIIIAIMDIWNAVKPVVDMCIDYVKKILEPVIDGLSQSIGGIIDVIKGIADFVSGVFTGNWKKAWEGIKTIFKGVWDTFAGIIKTPINMVLASIEFMVNKLIDGFNLLKKALNKISFDIPDWIPGIGGQKWGFNLKMSDNIKLPRLAKGDVAYEQTTAIIGEYANARTNPEIVSPVSMMKDSFRDVLNEFSNDLGGTRIDKLVVDVAGENFYQGTVDFINEENTRRGVNIIKEM